MMGRAPAGDKAGRGVRGVEASFAGEEIGGRSDQQDQAAPFLTTAAARREIERSQERRGMALPRRVRGRGVHDVFADRSTGWVKNGLYRGVERSQAPWRGSEALSVQRVLWAKSEMAWSTLGYVLRSGRISGPCLARLHGCTVPFCA